jgi:hypothetical protein
LHQSELTPSKFSKLERSHTNYATSSFRSCARRLNFFHQRTLSAGSMWSSRRWRPAAHRTFLADGSFPSCAAALRG